MLLSRKGTRGLSGTATANNTNLQQYKEMKDKLLSLDFSFLSEFKDKIQLSYTKNNCHI